MLKLYVAAQTFLSRPLRRDDRGVTSVEYALLVTFIAVAIIAAVTGLGKAIISSFLSAAKAATPG